jgi:penicillin-binding protein 1C
MKKALRRIAIAAAALCAVPVLSLGAYVALDRAFPLPPMSDVAVSPEVVDRDGALLRAFATKEGRWRLETRLEDIDPAFVSMLIAYEDKRFYSHHGVDPLALARSAWQFARHGRIVSGGSTLSMQLARLMEPRGERGLGRKARQMFRAIQIERRLTKEEILLRYLTLAPYGGNVEGVRAASLAWFGKEPKKLLLSEAALLVALPQAPESRRPDRHPKTAKASRDRVLRRMADAGAIETGEVARASAAAFNARRRGFPALAPHLSEYALRLTPEQKRIQVTLKKSVQQALETVAKDSAKRIGANLSVSMIMADARTGEILAEVGSANYFDGARSGWVDMTRAPRSPGSTLKPFIYAIAIEEGLVMPETLIGDRPANFAGYRPENFDTTYQGDVSIRQALQMSLNVPAVQVLESVGTPSLLQRFHRSGVEPVLPGKKQAGLAIGLGGIGMSLADLVQSYAAIANGGLKVQLTNGIGDTAPFDRNQRVMSPQAAWHVTDILAGIPAPANVSPRLLAYKTGTSYGYRDAWSIGFDGRYVLGVWVGRSDNGAVPGSTGGGTAAPILFEAFNRSGLKPVPFRAPPHGTSMLTQSDLPQGLKRFVPRNGGLVPVKGATAPPQIVYPPDKARIDLAAATDGQSAPLVMKLQGGRAPFRWLANGRPLEGLSRRRVASWLPDGPGYSRLTVIDAAGKAASVDVMIE